MKKFENFWKKKKKKSFGFGKKNFGSDTDTDTHGFGRNSAPIPNFGRTLIQAAPSILSKTVGGKLLTRQLHSCNTAEKI